MDPGKVGVIPQAGFLGMHPRPHGSARRRADRNGAILAFKGDPARLQSLQGREPNVARKLHMGVPLIHAQDQDVWPA